MTDGSDGETRTVYKVLADNHRSQYQSWDWTWHLPDGGIPGDWVEIPKEHMPRICSLGFHGWNTLEKALAKREHRNWNVYEMEIEGDLDSDGNKSCGRRARLVRKLYDRDGEILYLSDIVWQ